jgi:hypothetical protein
MAALDQQTKQVRETLGGISARFKPVVDDCAETLIDLTETQYPEGQSPQDAMHCPYHLCGVATHLGVVYLLHPAANSNTTGTQQWWRVQYDTESSPPTIRRHPLEQQDVLERVTTESASALLIYAHKDALSAEPEALSGPLEDFVKKDGWNFQEELVRELEHAGQSWEDPSGREWEDVDYDTTADIPRGDWAQSDDWNSMSAQQYHKHARHDSNLSSTTLTPNTEHDDVGVQEMVEINGGMDALTGVSSRASSSTIEGDAMDVDGARHGMASMTSDATMADAQDEPIVQHIEIAEKKGG